ncbi:MAG: hypothetical protein K2H49_10370 [Muribaculaceae bacterium]|nr:hypothetical protein [Muribaculaceae bacterium]
MKKILLTILIVTFSLLTANAIKKIEANPINIGVSIVEYTDSASIVSDLKYYGYALKQSDKDGAIFSHANGSIIRFIMPQSTSNDKYPIIEVTTKAGIKGIDQIFKSLRFKKEKDSYERIASRYDKYITRCSIGNTGHLIIHREKKETDKD